MKILLIISALFLIVDVFLLDGHLFQNISLVLEEYSFLKWFFIAVFSFVASIMLFKLNINYFAEMAKKDDIEEKTEDFLEETEEELSETQETENTQQQNQVQNDIGSKTLPKN